MLRSATILLFFCFNVVFAQSTEGDKPVNQKDANNQKQGHWIIYNKSGKFPGYEDGQKVEEGQYLNNKKVGLWTKYYPNGNKKHEITFANNIPNGYAKFYYKDGTLQEEGMWRNNKWIGQYKYYHENGNLFYNWSYNSSGKREGHQEYYHANGNVMIEGEWDNGKEVGVLKEYYEDGSLKTEKTFNNGKIVPEKTKPYPIGKIYHPEAKKPDQTVATTSNKEGEVKKEVKKVEAKAVASTEEKPPGYLEDGEHTTYNSKGKKLKEGMFKDGQLVNGKRYIYSDSGSLEKTVIVKDGTEVEEVIAE